MICSSVNRDRFIARLPDQGRLYPNLEGFAGLTSPRLLARVEDSCMQPWRNYRDGLSSFMGERARSMTKTSKHVRCIQISRAPPFGFVCM
jgi:hypothetical protein